MTEEINELREKLKEYIIKQDITLQKTACLIGYRSAASVLKFIQGKTPKPNMRRLARIKALLEKS
jgi:hypothetical protein